MTIYILVKKQLLAAAELVGAAVAVTKRTLLTTLTSACVALGVSSSSAEVVEIDSALLLYSEIDRVSLAEMAVSAKHNFGSERIGSLKFVFDSLTGSSANGATPANFAQTFTSPSGSEIYTVGAGETPLDGSFKDTRYAVDAGYSFPIDRLTTSNIGSHFSTELDYTSVGLNSSIARDLNKRNTTLSVGLAFSYDSINPQGGRPDPLMLMIDQQEESDDDDKILLNGLTKDDDQETPNRLSGKGTKYSSDIVFGLTQVIDRNTISRFNYSYGRVSGYQNDPYKFISVVYSDSINYLYEGRQDLRNKHVLFGEVKRNISGDVLTASYRYMQDDWGVNSHTIDMRYRWKKSEKSSFRPHFRWYQQSASDNYRPYLSGDDPIPEYASADYRLSEMTAITYGLKYSKTMRSGRSFSVRLEHYKKLKNKSPPGAPEAVAGLDLYPSVDAIILQAGFSLGF
jgi:hypothetical protein